MCLSLLSLLFSVLFLSVLLKFFRVSRAGSVRSVKFPAGMNTLLCEKVTVLVSCCIRAPL